MSEVIGELSEKRLLSSGHASTGADRLLQRWVAFSRHGHCPWVFLVKEEEDRYELLSLAGGANATPVAV